MRFRRGVPAAALAARDLAGTGESAPDRHMRHFLDDFKLQIVFQP